MRSIRAMTLSGVVLTIPLLVHGVLAASPAPGTQAPAVASVAPTEVPFPKISMAPLVTPAPLPAIAAPSWRVQDVPIDGYALGAPDAPVTVEVFEDFQCPYCLRFSNEVLPQLIDGFVRPGTARLVFRDLPFLGLESQWASVAARLAADQGKFWDFYMYLYANQLAENVGGFTPDRLMRIAQAAGLDMDTFIAGLQVPAARQTFAGIIADIAPRIQAYGISATPTVVVDGVKLASPDLATVSAAIQAALGASGSSSPAASAGASASPAAAASGSPTSKGDY